MLLQNYARPESIEEAYKLLLQEEKNIVIGGGAWLKLTNKQVDTVIDLSSIGLNEIIEHDDYIEIGAMTSLRQIETSETIETYYNGMLNKAVKHIMGMNVRNIATFGGSVMGKYSFSDILAPLLTMDTSLVFYRSGVISLSEYLNTRQYPKDILLAVRIEKKNAKGFFHTVKKTALDFAVINFAVTKGETIKIAIGARPSVALRATETEKFINSVTPTEENILKAAVMAREEIKVSSNSRASKDYRNELIEVYVKRGLQEVLSNES